MDDVLRIREDDPQEAGVSFASGTFVPVLTAYVQSVPTVAMTQWRNDAMTNE
jgi:hypothetical protein